MSAAFYLAKEGIKSVVLDSRGVCEGATARNGGHMWPVTTYPTEYGIYFIYLDITMVITHL